MPGTVGAVTGFIERQKGRGYVESSALQRFGKGGAAMAGGGNIFVGQSAAGIGNGADTTEDVLFTVSLPAIVSMLSVVRSSSRLMATSRRQARPRTQGCILVRPCS
jgi:hypothetical protein